MMLTQAALNNMRNHLRYTIGYAQYKVDGVYYRADIQNTQVLADGRVEITFLINHTAPGSITITEVQLYDQNGVLFASKPEQITRISTQEGILYRFRFTITEI